MSDASNPSQSGAPVGAQALPQALGGAPVAPAAPAADQPPAGAATPAQPAPGVLQGYNAAWVGVAFATVMLTFVVYLRLRLFPEIRAIRPAKDASGQYAFA